LGQNKEGMAEVHSKKSYVPTRGNKVNNAELIAQALARMVGEDDLCRKIPTYYMGGEPTIQEFANALSQVMDNIENEDLRYPCGCRQEAHANTIGAMYAAHPELIPLRTITEKIGYQY
jgi:hypothetical protein